MLLKLEKQTAFNLSFHAIFFFIFFLFLYKNPKRIEFTEIYSTVTMSHYCVQVQLLQKGVFTRLEGDSEL